MNRDLLMNHAVRLHRWMYTCLLGVFLLGSGGCVQVHMPKPVAGKGIQVQELAAHIDFLTQPALKGRKCRSVETWYVRQYIRRQFEATGLVPWPKASGFDQSFGFGTNVVGVLRGSDPARADEVVLVCAHYDGLGEKGGKILPGAASGAAGVAILLQVAERLAGQREGLRRSVAFAALDCGEERYLGAFALSLRKDLDPAHLAAVIDMDLLGRKNFDVIDNTLIVAGTQQYPEIRRMVNEAAEAPASQDTTGNTTTHPSAPQTSPAARAFRIMQAGGDVLPPISGYFAFEQWPVPVLLFTNGLYSDYHKPTDTADKLNYDVLGRDADVILRTVRQLASEPNAAVRVEPTQGDRDELRFVLMTVEEVLAHEEQLLLTAGERQKLGQIVQRARGLLAQPEYSLAERKAFILELAEKGAPSIIRFFYDPPKPDPAILVNPRRLAEALAWYEFFASHRPFASYGLQQVVKHFLDARGNLLRLLSTYTFNSCDIRDDEIAFVRQGADRFHLSFVYPHLKIQAGISARELNVEYEAADCRGTEGEVFDYCLLYWSLGEEGCMSRIMPTILTKVTGQEPGNTYEEWLALRLEQLGLADEDPWQRDPDQRHNADLLKMLLKKAAAGKKAGIPAGALAGILGDRTMRADVRTDAIAALPAAAPKETLLLLADLMHDNTLVRRGSYVPAFDPTFPFYNHVAMREVRTKPVLQVHGTVGMAAYAKLKELTRQDFRGDVAAWRGWIEANR